jgi:hypothetical protein
MTETELDLARRLVAHPKWAWAGGMLWGHGDPATRDWCWGRWPDPPAPDGSIPDLADPATRGCLQAMLYEAGEGIVAVVPDPVMIDHYAVCDSVSFEGRMVWAERHGLPRGPLGEALARALLAVWGES